MVVVDGKHNKGKLEGACEISEFDNRKALESIIIAHYKAKEERKPGSRLV